MGLWDWIIGPSSEPKRSKRSGFDWDAYRKANYTEEDWARYRARVAKVKREERQAAARDRAAGLERRR